jgi:type I restriction enzyme S subunit
MAGEWKITNFENAPLEIIDGDRGSNYPTQSEFSNKGYCLFLNAGNVTKSGFDFTNCEFISLEKDRLLRKGKLARNDVVLTTRGTVGNSAFFNDSVTFDNIRINSGMVILRAKQPDLDPRYLYLFVKSELFHSQVTALRTGSAQPQLPIRDIYRIKILIPPLPEQRAIAHILGTLDDKIELNRRMSQTLEAMARALFKSWFVDFDPVRAKAAVRREHPKWTNAQVSRAAIERAHGNVPLRPEIADLFPDRLVDSELGEIPEGWGVGTLGRFSEKPQYGYTASAKEEPVGPNFLRITDINKLPWIDWSTVPYCEIEPEDFEQYRLHSGDVLIARMADPGHGVVIEEQVEAVFASYLIRFRLKDKAYIRYIQYWLRSDRYWELVASRYAGTTRASLNAQVLSSFQLVIPPKPIALAFSKIVNALRNKVVVAVNESRTLAALRDALLPKLISGEIRVKDAPKIVLQSRKED